MFPLLSPTSDVPNSSSRTGTGTLTTTSTLLPTPTFAEENSFPTEMKPKRKWKVPTKGRGRGRGRGSKSRQRGNGKSCSNEKVPEKPPLYNLLSLHLALSQQKQQQRENLSEKSLQTNLSKEQQHKDLNEKENEDEVSNAPEGSPSIAQLLKADQSQSDQFQAAQRLAAAVLTATAAASNNMKGVPPMSLPGSLPMPFSPDILWRYPNPFMPQPPPSPLETQLKAHLPGGLGHDPRLWSREDVMVFLKYCEKEFDLEKIDMDKFQMNGKALCLLNKNDLSERCSGAGDVIHNILQLLIREAPGSAFPPSSPLTPRPPGLITPTSPAFPSSPHAWPLLSGAAAVHAAASVSGNESGATQTFPNLGHLISQTNSVTLSPAHSVDSHNGGSPKQQQPPQGNPTSENLTIHQLYPIPNGSASKLQVPPPLTNGNTTSSSHSDSEDSQEINLGGQRSPKTPSLLIPPRSPKDHAPTSSSQSKEGDTPELQTNGRLLWDFLQQLLNDSQQRYLSYISWKDKESGVFKIVDPPGLAKLWGIQKNHLSMNYDKMSRALRYYYRVNILRKVQGERHCYQFLRNPTELKSIKNISLLRQQMEAQAQAHKMAAQQAAQAAIQGQMNQQRTGEADRSGSPIVNAQATSSSDEPTDLTLGSEEKALRVRERIERERYLAEARNGSSSLDDRDREHLDKRRRTSNNSSFDFRNLIPQVSLKTENF